ncbi:MAG: hypothetical protein ACRC1T_05480 [Clostridium chrysemydis]|uniref:hypothetical protein n=1 Tax=Clostridium chrysemydis TaxID=2665504 RepID=UPI003F2BBD20
MMIEYHVYGQVIKEYYFMSVSNRYDYWSNSLTKKCSEDEIFKKIKDATINCNRFFYERTVLTPILEKWFNKGYSLVKYKEFKIITTELELRDNEIIRIEGEDYSVKYKYNDDTRQNELYIDKVIETIIDEEELKHAKQVCNGVVKRIIKYNREIEEFNKNNEKQIRFKNIRLTKIWRNWFK